MTQAASTTGPEKLERVPEDGSPGSNPGASPDRLARRSKGQQDKVKSSPLPPNGSRKRCSSSSLSPEEAAEVNKKRKEAAVETMASVSPVCANDKENENGNVGNSDVFRSRSRSDSGNSRRSVNHRRSSSRSKDTWDTMGSSGSSAERRRNSSGGSCSPKTFGSAKRNLSYDLQASKETKGMSSGSFYGTPSPKSPALSPRTKGFSGERVLGANRTSLNQYAKTFAANQKAANSVLREKGQGQSLRVPKVHEVASKQSDCDLIGFPNFGNTCFHSSLMVCLTALPYFRRDFRRFIAKVKLSQGDVKFGENRVLKAFDKLLCIRDSGVKEDEKIKEFSKQILDKISTEKGYGVNAGVGAYKQQDVHEYMLHFLESVERELKPFYKEHDQEMIPNPFIQYFGGNIESKKTCLGCGKVQVEIDGSEPCEVHIIHYSSQEEQLTDELSHMVRATFRSKSELPCDKCREKRKGQRVEEESDQQAVMENDENERREAQSNQEAVGEDDDDFAVVPDSTPVPVPETTTSGINQTHTSETAPAPGPSPASQAPVEPVPLSEFEETKLFRQVPRVLALSLATVRTYSHSKANCKVDFPVRLNLEEFSDLENRTKEQLLQRIEANLEVIPSLVKERTRTGTPVPKARSKVEKGESEVIGEVSSQSVEDDHNLKLLAEEASLDLNRAIADAQKDFVDPLDLSDSFAPKVINSSAFNPPLKGQDGKELEPLSKEYEDEMMKAAVDASLKQEKSFSTTDVIECQPDMDKDYLDALELSGRESEEIKQREEAELEKALAMSLTEVNQCSTSSVAEDAVTSPAKEKTSNIIDLDLQQQIELATQRSLHDFQSKEPKDSSMSTFSFDTEGSDLTSYSEATPSDAERTGSFNIRPPGDTSSNFADVSNSMAESRSVNNASSLSMNSAAESVDLDFASGDLVCQEKLDVSEIERPRNPQLDGTSDLPSPRRSFSSESTPNSKEKESRLERLKRNPFVTVERVPASRDTSTDSSDDNKVEERAAALAAKITNGNGQDYSTSEMSMSTSDYVSTDGNEDNRVTTTDAENSYIMNEADPQIVTQEMFANVTGFVDDLLPEEAPLASSEFKVPLAPLPRPPKPSPKVWETQSPNLDPDFDYRLFALVRHVSQSISYGHYLTDCYSLAHHCWYRYDDSDVRHIPLDHVLGEKDNVYLVLYLHKSYFTGSHDELEVKIEEQQTSKVNLDEQKVKFEPVEKAKNEIKVQELVIERPNAKFVER